MVSLWNSFYHNNYMKQVNLCPLCKSDAISALFTSYNRHGRHDINKKDTFHVKRCSICDVVFLADATVNEAYYKKYYDTGYYDGGLSADNSLINRLVKVLESWSSKQKEKILLKYAPKRKQKLKILDVGCGSGKFLDSLSLHKFEKYGVEINEEGINLSRKKGFTVYDKDITEINFGKKRFDIITLWHVAEHLTDPIGVFKKIHDSLENDGIVLIATPNTGSMGFKMGKSKWFHLDSPRHLMLFNMKSTQFLCKKTKLDVTAQVNEFYDYPLDLFWSVKDTAFKYIIYPLYPIMKYFDIEALTLIFKKSNK